MPETRILHSISDIPAEHWNRCFRGAIEDHACLRAIERAGLPGYTFRYILIEEDGGVLAAAPVFLTSYPLATMMEGGAARLVARFGRALPGLFAPRLACLGSPCTENAGIGFAPELTPFARRALAPLLLATLDRIRADAACPLLGVKDLGDADRSILGSALAAGGLVALSGQPIAWLPIDFPDVDGYLGRLSKATRRSLRRKLRTADAIRIEHRDRIDDVRAEVHALYRATRARAAQHFEDLTADYFTATLAAMPGRAFVTLYYAGEDLLAANLLMQDGTTLLDKYWCMADAGRDHALYHLSWVTNIRHCLAHGLLRYQAGQASAALKRSLGCRFDPTTTYFRHRSRVGHRALRLAVPYLGGDHASSIAA